MSSEIPAALAGSLLKRFWTHVDRSKSCWEWTSYRSPTGYGQFGINAKLKMQAHRFIDAVMNGPHAQGECTLHRCDNPSCVRPSHLFRGTQADNMRDMAQKGRSGQAKLDEDDVRAIHARHEEGASQRDIARSYGVHQTNIGHILRGTTWTRIYKEVHEP